MNILLVGDIHSKFELLISKLDKSIDIIITPGDIGIFRNKKDYEGSRIKQKHITDKFEIKDMPIPLYFIAGNHEPNLYYKNVLNGKDKLPYNMNFLGYSGNMEISNLKIGGISGNYSPKYYFYSRDKLNIKQLNYYIEEDISYIRELELDILLIHDWPNCISNDKIRFKDNLSEHMTKLIIEKQFDYVIAGHMHYYHEQDIGKTKFISLPILKETSQIIELFKYKNNIFHMLGDEHEVC